MPQPFALAAAAAAGALLATLLTRRQRDAPQSPNVRHVVLVQLKPETPAAAVDAMLAALRRLPAQIPTILRLEVGRQLSSLDDGRNASIGGLVEFASESEYAAYATHAAHVAAIKDFILPHMVDGGRTAMQIALNDDEVAGGRAAMQTAVGDAWVPQTWTGESLTRRGLRRIAFEMRFDKTRLAE